MGGPSPLGRLAWGSCADPFRLRWNQSTADPALWNPAGEEMYKLSVDLRGFYLKTGQFMGARGDFVPRPICERLSRLHDQVPPMTAAQARQVIESELAGARIEDVFDWIELDEPLGSASISQVHKAKLRRRYAVAERFRLDLEDWERGGATWQQRLASSAQAAAPTAQPRGKDRDSFKTDTRHGRRIVAACCASSNAKSLTILPPRDQTGGQVVAVKVQYPNALGLMVNPGKPLLGAPRFARTLLHGPTLHNMNRRTFQVALLPTQPPLASSCPSSSLPPPMAEAAEPPPFRTTFRSWTSRTSADSRPSYPRPRFNLTWSQQWTSWQLRSGRTWRSAPLPCAPERTLFHPEHQTYRYAGSNSTLSGRPG